MFSISNLLLGFSNVYKILKNCYGLNKFLQKNPIVILLGVISLGIFYLLTYQKYLIMQQDYKRRIIDAFIQARSYNQEHLNKINQEFCMGQKHCYTILISIVYHKTIIVNNALFYTQVTLNNRQVLEQIDVTKLTKLHCEKVNCDQLQLFEQDYTWLRNRVPNNTLTPITLREIMGKDSFRAVQSLEKQGIYGYIIYPIYFDNQPLYYIGLAVDRELFDKPISYYHNLENIGMNIKQQLDIINIL
jgi:hypothetical protein